MVFGGALDSFGPYHRAQYFAPSDKFETVIEHAIKYGNSYQSQKNQTQNSLFGDMSDLFLKEPEIKDCEAWSLIETLTKEKEVTGIYLSGHPLDDYKVELRNFTSCTLEQIDNIRDRNVQIAGLVTDVFHGVSRKGLGYGKFTLQDYTGGLSISLFSEHYKQFKELVEPGTVLFVDGINQKGYSSDQYFFRVKDIKLLDTIGKTMTKSITLQVQLKDISDKLIQDLELLCQNHKGKHDLKLMLVDGEHDYNLSFKSKKKKVRADNEFVSQVERLGIRYRLNKR